MDIETKMWGYTSTGTKLHGFINGVALCRSNIKAPAQEFADHSEARGHAKAQWGIAMCQTCDDKFNAAVERAEASMQPSTAEGDYLPSADDVTRPRWAKTDPRCTCLMLGSDYEHHNLCPTLRADPAAEVRTHHYNATGGQRWIDGRGWVNHCAVCKLPEGTGDHFHNTTTTDTTEEDPLNNKTGPLTERQTDIIRRIRSGRRYHRIAEDLGVSQALVHHEASNILAKLKAATMPQAICLYTTAMAYREAAVLLDSGRIPSPVGETEECVNDILRGLASTLRYRAERLLPQ